jgi:multisubunit Na+/H+ antiporter MnhG subunit
MRRARLTRLNQPPNHPTRIFLGVILVIAGLIGLVTAPDRVEDVSWRTYALPAVMLLLGCGHLFLAWRQRDRHVVP